jgi:hypothetical protein
MHHVAHHLTSQCILHSMILSFSPALCGEAAHGAKPRMAPTSSALTVSCKCSLIQHKAGTWSTQDLKMCPHQLQFQITQEQMHHLLATFVLKFQACITVTTVVQELSCLAMSWLQGHGEKCVESLHSLFSSFQINHMQGDVSSAIGFSGCSIPDPPSVLWSTAG